MNIKLSIAIVAVLALTACTDSPRAEPVFPLGTIVKSKVSGARGQVVSVACFSVKDGCRYDVRFAASQQRTDVSLLGKDGPIATEPLARINYMREFELEADEPAGK